MGPHTMGASNTVDTCNMASTSNMVGSTNTAGLSNTVCASNMAKANIMVGVSYSSAAIVQLDANTTSRACTSSGANIILGASGFSSVIHPLVATIKKTPHENLRILELKSHIHTTATGSDSSVAQLPIFVNNCVPLILEEASHASRMVATQRTHFEEQEDRIEALIWDIYSLLKKTQDKSLIIPEEKA